MVYIKTGSFVMGGATNILPEYNIDELPQHAVQIGSFYVDSCEVTKAKWDEVYAWAVDNAYHFDSTGASKATNHPAVNLNWYDTNHARESV